MNTANLLADLFARLSTLGVQPRGVAVDSRQVAPGDLFLALPGSRSHGRDFIDQAIARGAAAVLVPTGETPLAHPSAHSSAHTPASVPLLEVADLPILPGPLAHALYGQPSSRLWLAGITGTNGKTSVSQWIAQALAALGQPCGVIGTLGNGFPGQLTASPNTTPDAATLHRQLAGFCRDGAQACAMEVSSIGLDQHRLDGCEFNVAVFTNLSRDHLDYHGSMEAYAAAKEKLFLWPGLQAAVINLDDPFGVSLAARLKNRLPTWGYTLGDAAVRTPIRHVDHLLSPDHLHLTARGLAFELAGTPGIPGIPIDAPVLGRFNASNLLAVIGALRSAGHDLSGIATALRQIQPPPGRMEMLGGSDAPLVVVDYAHTPDALEKVLGVLRETAASRGGQLVCVFGCGGDRDPGKRPLMGAAVESLADRSVVTSDNPRSESPQTILDQILSGMTGSPQVEPDRAQAIRRSIREAGNQDVILLAGKGHEPYQEIKGVKYPFSDLDLAKSALAERQP